MKTDKIKMQFDAIASVLDYCERQIKDVQQEYAPTGEMVKEYEWKDGHHVVKIDEDGNPVMHERYAYINKDPASLDPDDLMKIEVWQHLQELIFKVIKESFK